MAHNCLLTPDPLIASGLHGHLHIYANNHTHIIKNNKTCQVVVVRAFNPSTQEAETGGSIQGYTQKPCLNNNNNN